ncbi:flagellar hook-basal body complex protein FliE [Allorhizobium terrae]|uniref:Flagellar hook-basal body complex protein FliE n=1 Tax=Allorhizobium terrae TaxID=1848972 RepID=A0A4S3ZY87_9HYPH|nr:flagellar hook-basal body complex protein FliE [Allorhizobium terrae]THF50824.1 flagellar hook-basal body complex protein FliE [Allorhizobium terrae]TWD55431.1 flagellar hook-basal body complex protein FliE [Agrobacterium vitis]
MIDSIGKMSSLTKSSSMSGIGGESSSTSSISGGMSDLGMQGVTQAGTTPGTATGVSFGEVIGGMMTDAVKNLRTAESNSVGGMLGKVSTREVVDSMMSAERSLQTAITLRDKIVSAYLDITKMQI